MVGGPVLAVHAARTHSSRARYEKVRAACSTASTARTSARRRSLIVHAATNISLGFYSPGVDFTIRYRSLELHARCSATAARISRCLIEFFNRFAM